MYFETERLTVRPFSDADREKMVEVFYDESTKKTYMIPDFKSRADAERLFERFLELSNSADRLVGGIYSDNELVGFINDTGIEGGSVEFGYVVLPEYRNLGYCTEALGGAIDFLFSKGCSEVICGAFEENTPSLRVMQKCGMQRIEKLDVIEYRGQKHNCIYYSIKK